LVVIKEYLKKQGIRPESFKDFEREMKRNFQKKRELISLTRIREATGRHPEQIKKYLSAMVELHRIRTCDAYFLGCPLTELIVVNFGFGDMALCPTCDHEVLLPSEGGEVVCDCGVHYVKRAPSRWVYEPRLRHLDRGEWELESLSTPGEFYTVNIFERSCSCPHYHYRGAYCKHMKKTAGLVATFIFKETMNGSNLPSHEGLAVITAAIRRWFDPREHMRMVTYRELRNDVEKISGLKLTTHGIARIISKFEEKGVLKRTQDPRQGVGCKTLIAINQWALRLLLKLGKEKISDASQEDIVSEPPEEERIFLKLDRVVHAGVALPHTEFKVGVHVNYWFPKPTGVRLDVRVGESRKVAGSLIARLNGESVVEFSLTPTPPTEKLWRLRLELCQQDEKGEWRPADQILSSQQIHTPTIKIHREGACKVESFSEPEKFYDVDVFRNWCSCPDHLYNLNRCKHLRAVEKIMETTQDLMEKEPFMTQGNQKLEDVNLHA